MTIYIGSISGASLNKTLYDINASNTDNELLYPLGFVLASMLYQAQILSK
jgi:hypothetical protein